MTNVIKLASFNVDTQALLSCIRQALNVSGTADIDRQGIPADTNHGYLRILCTLKSIKEVPDSILKQVVYSYLVVTVLNPLPQLAIETDLSIFETKRDDIRLIILTGDLKAWRDCVIDCCNDSVSTSVRFVITQCMRELESEGLGFLWSDYRKTQCKDGGIKLIER